jgi:hypothetical protein
VATFTEADDDGANHLNQCSSSSSVDSGPLQTTSPQQPPIPSAYDTFRLDVNGVSVSLLRDTVVVEIVREFDIKTTLHTLIRNADTARASREQQLFKRLYFS